MSERPQIFVVDDDPHLRKTLSDILVVKGYDVVCAANGGEAIESSRRYGPFDVLLIDLRLPDMAGLDVMTRVKEASPLIEAIILTGHASMDTAIEATRRGAFSYLLKPYEIDELLLVVRQAVDRHRTQTEVLRLASHPQLNPNPIIELDTSGQVTYLNPAAEKRFVGLSSQRLSHPVLAGALELMPRLLTDEGSEVVREVTVGNAIYEERLSHVPDSGFVRIQALDITKRKQADTLLATRAREEAGVAELGTAALSGLDMATLWSRAAVMVADRLGATSSIVLEREPNGHRYLLPAGAGWDATRGATASPAADGWLRRVLETDGPAVFSQVPPGSCPELPSLPDRRPIATGIAIAIQVGGEPVGVIGAFDSAQRDFSADDRRFMTAVANVLAASVSRQQAEHEIHLLATIDTLTGVLNRREFSRTVAHEMDRAARYRTPLTLVMLDIDHFKRINDTWGHDAGDRVLREVTVRVRASLRSVDALGRWGGEEFMVLLPQTELVAGAQVAEKLRVAIAAEGFGAVGQVTASLGVTVFADGETVGTLAKRVDEALYRAKSAGRNRVEILDGSTCPRR